MCSHPSSLPAYSPPPAAGRYVKQHIAAAKRTLMGNPFMRQARVWCARQCCTARARGLRCGCFACYAPAGCPAAPPACHLLPPPPAHSCPALLRSWRMRSTSPRARPASATTRSAPAACRSSRPPSATTRWVAHRRVGRLGGAELGWSVQPAWWPDGRGHGCSCPAHSMLGSACLLPYVPCRPCSCSMRCCTTAAAARPGTMLARCWGCATTAAAAAAAAATGGPAPGGGGRPRPQQRRQWQDQQLLLQFSLYLYSAVRLL